MAADIPDTIELLPASDFGIALKLNRTIHSMSLDQIKAFIPEDILTSAYDVIRAAGRAQRWHYPNDTLVDVRISVRRITVCGSYEKVITKPDGIVERSVVGKTYCIDTSLFVGLVNADKHYRQIITDHPSFIYDTNTKKWTAQ